MIQQPNFFKFTLICLGKEYVLPQAPEGWEESELRWERSLQYWGMMRTLSERIIFVLDGAWLLRRVLYSQGVDGQCILRIEILDRSTWTYNEVVYEGDVDFSTVDDALATVEANMMELGVTSSVAAYSNVDYEWPVTEEDTVAVRLPGIDQIEIGEASPAAFNAGTFGYFPAMFINSNELESNHVAMQDTDFGNVIPNQPPSPDNWFIEGIEPTTQLRIYGTWKYFHFYVPYYWYQLELVDSAGNTVAMLFTTQGNPATQTESEYDVTIPVVAGQRLWVVVKRYGSGGGVVPPFLRTDDGVMSVSYPITTEPSVVRAYRPKKLFQMLIDRMNVEPVNVQSALLDQWDNLLITSGDAIRAILGATIKTKFDDYYKSINAVLNVGFGVRNGIPIIESKSYWFRDALQIIDLGDSAKDVVIRPAQDVLFNSIKAGYPNDDYDVKLGREEYNNGQIWSTPIKRIQKQLDISSVYRADQYGMEQLRIIAIKDAARENINEVDKKNDNEVFFIHAQKTAGEDGIFDVIGEEAYTNISGISTRSSSYNLGITPKKNMLRHADFLASILYLNTGQIKFESSDKNAELSTTDLSGRTVKENVNIDISLLGRPLFLPFEAEMTTDLPINAWKQFDTNTTGYVKFRYRDSEFYGFVVEASQQVFENGERTFRLFLTANCDVSKLIY